MEDKYIKTANFFNEAALIRGYFEGDADFHPAKALLPILRMYDDACTKAAKKAKYAIQSGKVEDLREAQWYEAIAATLEHVLTAFDYEDGANDGVQCATDIQFPNPPSFK